VCGANLALVQGIIEGADDVRMPHLVPRDGHCCVEVKARDDTAAREHPTSAEGGSA
jgi:hypothetical protein